PISVADETHSALMPANLITLAHFSVSSAMSLPKSVGVIGVPAPPKVLARRAFILGFTRPALISHLILLIIPTGALLEAPTPYHPLASYPVTNSPTVGTSGSTSDRAAVVTAKARSFPVLTYSIDSGAPPNTTCTCPPSRSVSAGAPPRYGTWTM